MIFDEAMLQKEKRIGLSVELFKRAKGSLIEANGYEQLAKEIGVQPIALKETLEKFNASVTAGCQNDAVICVDDVFSAVFVLS